MTTKIDYTVVIGVDAGHIDQMRLSMPTWAKHKPDLLNHPLVCFYDRDSVTPDDVKRALPPWRNFVLYAWPPTDAEPWDGDPNSKWTNPQRAKMLSGFVHVPPRTVSTKYWLKLDLDAVALGQPDWIDPSWFDGDPAIISHPWSYTKPPDQMMNLDKWVSDHKVHMPPEFDTPPLMLVPEPGSNLVKHERIISWCAFFEMDFSVLYSEIAEDVCGTGKLPVPSQDGYHWYCAARSKRLIRTVNMKRRGWAQCHGKQSIIDHIRTYGL